jgi:hypothetical protein
VPALDTLFVVVILLYVLDSVSVADRHAWSFSGWRASRWSPGRGIEFLLLGERQLIIGSLLPPLNPTALVDGAALDAGAAAARLTLLRRHGAAVRVLANALFVATFGGFAIVLLAFDAPPFIWALVASIAGLWIATAIALVRARRALAGLAPQPPLLPIVLSPLSVMRAQDTLASRLLAGLHPLAVASVACPPPKLAALARRYYYTSDGGIDGDVAAFLKTQGLLPLVTAAPAQDNGTQAYCPRCSAQYVEGATACVDCDGRSLVRFQTT